MEENMVMDIVLKRVLHMDMNNYWVTRYEFCGVWREMFENYDLI